MKLVKILTVVFASILVATQTLAAVQSKAVSY